MGSTGAALQENVQDHPASSDLNCPTGSVRQTHRLKMERLEGVSDLAFARLSSSSIAP